MNRELRRLNEKEEKRQRQQRAKGAAQRVKKERVGIRQFLREVRQELNRVAWPTRQEVMTFTTVTVITTASLTAIVFGMDFVFKQTILELIRSL
ncbi:MAG: preprotein translocase subunit SecE [Acidimicrobiia bacterium]|nr:preprotein translocase subunit SecE [Acidimicrobiia bacterium]